MAAVPVFPGNNTVECTAKNDRTRCFIMICEGWSEPNKTILFYSSVLAGLNCTMLFAIFIP